MNDSSILTHIHSPSDLKALPAEAMKPLADEIRAFLVEKVTAQGGHLASNLGVVELSIALHRVFDTPRDHIIWDVGHQSYVHKILTGRFEQFDTLRVPGGLSGFEKRAESEHDAFGTGHSSTALSAAIGFAEADRIAGRDAYSIAVVGDGAFTGGMVHEALNNCAGTKNLILILNENEMSISKNIGSFARYMAKIRTSSRYFRTKARTTSVLSKIPLVGRGLFVLIRACKRALKNALFGSNFFEEMGLFYLGPADGNDYETVERLLREAKKKGENVIIHLKTKKGKGYAPAEEEPNRYHGIEPAGMPADIRYHDVFGDVITSLASEDDRVCAVTAAMGIGTGLAAFADAHRDRYYDVGIAEEHAVTFAAALAAGGMKPYAVIYSTFLQRAYDNLLHDVCLQNLPVRIIVDRASLAVSDGATHHGVFDVAFLSEMPHMRVLAPATFETLRAMLRDSLTATQPLAIRYPNAPEDGRVAPRFYPDGDFTAYGVRADFGSDSIPACVVVTYGVMTSRVLDAEEKLRAEGYDVGVVLLEKLKPYDEVAKSLLDLTRGKPVKILFAEEGVRAGGAGMMLRDALERALPSFASERRYRILAIDDPFETPDAPGDLRAACHIACDDVIAAVREELK